MERARPRWLSRATGGGTYGFPRVIRLQGGRGLLQHGLKSRLFPLHLPGLLLLALPLSGFRLLQQLSKDAQSEQILFALDSIP